MLDNGVTESSTLDVVIFDGVNEVTLDNAVVFSANATPIVNTVSPQVGDYLGGYNLTIQGENFNSGNAEVFIDGIECLVHSTSDTEIICEVQERFDDNEQMDFEVSINGQTAILNNIFFYALRWSEEITWGYDFKPNEGDLIHVPAGQSLWVDESTPALEGIVVEGRIIFADEADMTITTNFIIINGGIFQAGTESKPYRHNLLFNMTGDS